MLRDLGESAMRLRPVAGAWPPSWPSRARQRGSPAVDGLTLGQLELVMPEGDPQGLVFLFSDEAGPTAELTQAASSWRGWA